MSSDEMMTIDEQQTQQQNIPEDLFSCLICYETFGFHPSQPLVVLKCGHLFCANCIQQWLTLNKVCPTCRKRCALKDLLSIDLSNSIVAYGTKKIVNLNDERDRLKNQIELLQNSIIHLQRTRKQIEARFQREKRVQARLKILYRSRRKAKKKKKKHIR